MSFGGTFPGGGGGSSLEAGTDIGDVVQLEDVGGSAGLPAVDGSQLLNAPVSNDSVRTRSTGVFNGGVIAINGADDATFDLSAGGASLLDAWDDPSSPVSSVVEWAAQTGLTVTNTGGRTISYVGLRLDDVAPAGGDTQSLVVTIDGVAGTAYLTFSPVRYTSIDRRDIASLGLLFHPGGAAASIVTAEQLVNANIGPIHSLLDLFDVIGPVQTEGGVISAAGADLTLAVSAGVQFRPGTGWSDTAAGRRSVNFTDTPGASPATWQYSYRDGASGYSSTANTTSVDPDAYDDGDGGLAVVLANRWSIQDIYLFSSGAMRLVYDQTTYSTLDAARAALGSRLIDTNPAIIDGGVLVAQLIVRGGATDLSDAADAYIAPVSRFRSTAGGGGESNTLAVDPAATGVDPTSAQSGVELRVKGLLSGDGVAATVDGSDVRFDISPVNTGSRWFDGASSASITNAASPNLYLGAGDFTIEAWIHLGSVSGNNVICSRWEEADNASKNFQFSYDGTSDLRLQFYDTAVGPQVMNSEAYRLEDSSWHHVAVTWDASAEAAAFYINGRTAGTATITLTGTIQDGTADFVVGAEDGAGDFFTGHINLLRVWGDIRTQTEINATMHSVIGTAGDDLISEWAFNADLADPISSYDLTNNGSVQTGVVPWRV